MDQRKQLWIGSPRLASQRAHPTMIPALIPPTPPSTPNPPSPPPSGWACACMHAKSHQSCPTLFNSVHCSARQAPLSMGFSRQDYWSELPCPPPGDLPDPGIKPVSLKSPALAGRFFTTSTPWEAPDLCLPAPIHKARVLGQGNPAGMGLQAHPPPHLLCLF